MKILLFLLITCLSIQSKADISISGSAEVSVVNIESSAVVSFSGTSNSSSILTLESTPSSNTSSVLYNTSLNTDNKFKDMGRDLFLIPALLINLVTGDTYFDVSSSKSDSSYEPVSLPPCCSSFDPVLFAKPAIDSDKNLSIMFNKNIKHSSYYVTGAYQNIKSSRQSIIPVKDDLVTGCITCINQIDRDNMVEEYASLGVGYNKPVSPNASIYMQTAYTQMYLEYLINSSTLNLPITKISQNYEGIVNTVGIKVRPYKDFALDVSKDIFNLNGVNAPDRNNIKLLHKINDNLSVGFGYSESEYIDTYSKVSNKERSLILRVRY